MKKPRKSPCAECPFRRTSPAGYLGANDPEDFIAIAKEKQLPCHILVDYERDDWELQQQNVNQCTGQSIFLINHCHLPRDPAVIRAEKPDRELIFAHTTEFLAHHKKRRKDG